MALQLLYTAATGVVAPTAYWKINDFRGDKTSVTVTLAIYYDAATRTANKQAIGYQPQKLSIANGATLDAMYTALKALPAFTGALSV